MSSIVLWKLAKKAVFITAFTATTKLLKGHCDNGLKIII